ncbi:pentapeptide repeat-containing protein [Streptomyces sp. LARHCF249]
MDERLAGFLGTYLDAEQAYDTSGYLRPTLMSFNDAYVQAVRDGIAEMLRDPDFGTAEYEALTDVEFPHEASLRQYLRDMHAYLFEGGTAQPVPAQVDKRWSPRVMPADSEAAGRLREWLDGDGDGDDGDGDGDGDDDGNDGAGGGIDVMGLDLSGADLSGADFSESLFMDTRLVDARLAGAEFYRAELQGADLTRADLTNACLVRAQLDDAVLRNAVLDGADLGRASLYQVDASSARCRGTRFMGASLLDVNFRGADLSQAILQENSFRVTLDGDTVLTGLTGSLFGPVEVVEERGTRTIAGIELEKWIRSRGGDVRVLEPRWRAGNQG